MQIYSYKDHAFSHKQQSQDHFWIFRFWNLFHLNKGVTPLCIVIVKTISQYYQNNDEVKPG